MGPFLLDVNLLLGLFWPSHIFHIAALEWFVEFEHSGWATCPMTESGFLRVLSNPVFTAGGPPFQEAFELLTECKRGNANHRFWQHGTEVENLPRSLISRITHRDQLTDAYLIALALEKGGRLVTFDRRMIRLAPEGTPEREALVILRS